MVGHNDVLVDGYAAKVVRNGKKLLFGEFAQVAQVQLGTVKTVPYNLSEQVLLALGADRNEKISGTGVIKGFQTKLLSIWMVIHLVTLLCEFADGCYKNRVHTAERSRPFPTEGMCQIWLFQLAEPIIHMTSLLHAFARSLRVLQGTIWQMVAMVWVLRR